MKAVKTEKGEWLLARKANGCFGHRRRTAWRTWWRIATTMVCPPYDYTGLVLGKERVKLPPRMAGKIVEVVIRVIPKPTKAIYELKPGKTGLGRPKQHKRGGDDDIETKSELSRKPAQPQAKRLVRARQG